MRYHRKPLHFNTLSSSLFAPADLTPVFGGQRSVDKLFEPLEQRKMIGGAYWRLAIKDVL